MKRIWGIFSFLRRKKAERPGRALVLVDWENMFINLGGRKSFSPDAVYSGFLKLEEEIARITNGEIVGVYVFASSDSAVQPTWEEIFWKLKYPVISCLKLPDGEKRIDTVDGILMREGSKLIRNMKLTHLFIATGDADFIPFYQEAIDLGLEIVTIYATKSSLSVELLKFKKKIIEFPLVQ